MRQTMSKERQEELEEWVHEADILLTIAEHNTDSEGFTWMNYKRLRTTLDRLHMLIRREETYFGIDRTGERSNDT